MAVEKLLRTLIRLTVRVASLSAQTTGNSSGLLVNDLVLVEFEGFDLLEVIVLGLGVGSNQGLLRCLFLPKRSFLVLFLIDFLGVVDRVVDKGRLVG